VTPHSSLLGGGARQQWLIRPQMPYLRRAAVWRPIVATAAGAALLTRAELDRDRRRWLLPMADGLATDGYLTVGPQRAVLVVRGADTTAMAWHVLYVIALVVVVAMVAIRRDRSVRRLPWLAAGGLGSMAGTLQVITAR